MAKKYFHELSHDEIDQLINDKKTWGFIAENYFRPKWCKNKDALNSMVNCWSLTDLRPEGNRKEISIDFCKSCDYFRDTKKIKANKEPVYVNVLIKKMEILNGIFKSEDGLTWNETAELLNELIKLAKNDKN